MVLFKKINTFFYFKIIAYFVFGILILLLLVIFLTKTRI